MGELVETAGTGLDGGTVELYRRRLGELPDRLREARAAGVLPV